ncbi:MAG: hypothetical protein SNG69_06610 [Rikenellaceae bacterium]
MIVPITREVKILLLKALKRGHFTEEEMIKLNSEIFANSDLLSLTRLGETIYECRKINEKIRQESNAESV